VITLLTSQLQEIVAHARDVDPLECCGLIGGLAAGHAQNIYQLRNVSPNPQVAYEAAPEDLFAAQRQMRERGEQLLAIYHSHPRAIEPVPSETDVRLAYYPSAMYLIVALGGDEATMRAFQISEKEQRWEEVEYAVADE
jgi:[CysO sulfur-carrier protein]-S-L-cysteine hydrolase